MRDFNEGLFAESVGACHPHSGAIITGGVYDELLVPVDVDNVRFNGPVFMADVTIRGKGCTGTIYVPETTTTIHPGRQQRHGREGEAAPASPTGRPQLIPLAPTTHYWYN